MSHLIWALLWPGINMWSVCNWLAWVTGYTLDTLRMHLGSNHSDHICKCLGQWWACCLSIVSTHVSWPLSDHYYQKYFFQICLRMDAFTFHVIFRVLCEQRIQSVLSVIERSAQLLRPTVHKKTVCGSESAVGSNLLFRYSPKCSSHFRSFWRDILILQLASCDLVT